MKDKKLLKYAIGVDLGGTFVKVALVSNIGKILFEKKLSIGAGVSRNVILETIKTAIQITINKTKEYKVDVIGIGIGTPGIVYKGIIQGGADNLNDWKNIDLATYFYKPFNLPVLIDNDANVMGLGEVEFGAAKGCTDAVFITVGTGIGGAVFIDGKLYGGFENRGAELGHITINHNGIDCNCGGRGCLEAYASTSALIKQYAEQSSEELNRIDGHFIVKKFKENEQNAITCMENHVDYLGHGIASFINIFAPQKVIIGGGISEAGQFYIDMIKKATFSYAMADCAKNTEIVAAILGNNAGCIGAASLIFKNSN